MLGFGVRENLSIIDEALSEQWPPAYLEHPVTRSAGVGERVVLIALYTDGVPTTKRDGVIGFWVYSLLSMRRHLVAILRKSELCRCGCKGWDSMYGIFRMLLWSFSALGSGTWPTTGPFGEPFAEGTDRCRNAGRPLPFKAALVQIKGVWMEFTSTLGFANWRTTAAPCVLCRCTTQTFFEFRGFAPGANPWALTSKQTYEDACMACETVTTVTAEQHARMKFEMTYDRRREGVRGRALRRPFPELRLDRNDRLEPSENLADPGGNATTTNNHCRCVSSVLADLCVDFWEHPQAPLLGFGRCCDVRTTKNSPTCGNLVVAKVLSKCSQTFRWCFAGGGGRPRRASADGIRF